MGSPTPSTARGGGNGKRRPRDRNPGGSEGVRNGRVAEHSGAGNLHCKDESANASAHPSWPDRGPDVSKCRRLNRRAPPRGGSRPHLQSARRQLLSENCVGTKVPFLRIPFDLCAAFPTVKEDDKAPPESGLYGPVSRRTRGRLRDNGRCGSPWCVDIARCDRLTGKRAARARRPGCHSVRGRPPFRDCWSRGGPCRS